MKNLNKDLISSIEAKENLFLPGIDQFNYPEKVLQFGTGVLLRGLPDQYIQAANNSGVFKGRIAVVKSTDTGGVDDFHDQDCLYTVCYKGISDGRLIEEYHVNAAVSRVLQAINDWEEILALANSPTLEIITSNTTEVGMIYKEEKIHEGIPGTFPGRLLKILHSRFVHFQGRHDKGLVIIPAELIDHNADVLRDVLIQLSAFNQLEPSFLEWLTTANHFCNTLVDRIVPGKLGVTDQEKAELELGYRDKLMIMAEPFGLWAIESNDNHVKEVLSFCLEGSGCLVVPSIEKFKELKLRLLNASHTFSCGVALLSGIEFVRDAMGDPLVSGYIRKLALEEIAKAIISDRITAQEASAFALQVLDRFSNPHLSHQWKNISAQFALKIKVRCVPLITQYVRQYGSLPQGMLIGLAAFLCYSGLDVDGENTLADTQLWGADLGALPGLKSKVRELANAISQNKILPILEKYTEVV
jgi:tagaturonate reductase